MADRKISIRLSLEDAEKVKAQLAALGSEGEKALRQIEQASKQPGPGLKALNELTEEGKHRLEAMGEEAGVFARALNHFGPAGFAAAAGLGALVAVIAESTKAVAEAETIHRRLDAVLQATGNTTGLARHEFDDLAQSLSKAFAIDDDKIKQVATSLASFSSISGPAFKGAFEQAAHLSAVFGGDLSENTEKIAVVMERLAGGSVDGLNKAFKFLSEAEKDQLRVMAESGRGFEAQMVLVDDLRKHLGDAGTEDSLNKATDRLHVAWEDLLKSIGDTRPWHDLLGLMADVVEGMNRLIGKSHELNSIGAVDDKIAELVKNRAHMVSEKARLQGQLTGNDFTDSPLVKLSVANAQKRIDAIDKETAALTKQRNEMHAAEVQAKAHAAAQQYDTLAAQDAAAEAKDLAEKTKGAADARGRAIDSINKQIAALKDERAQLNLSERERKIHIELIKAEQTAREAGFKLSAKTREDIIKAAGDAFDSEQVRALAEKQAKQISENIKHATDEVTNFGRDAFEKILEGGEGTFKSLSDSFVKFMRKAFAQIAAEAIIRPVVQPIISSALGGGNNTVTSILTGNSSGGGFSLSSLNNLPNINLFGSSTSGFINDIGGSLGFSVEAARPAASFIGPMPNAGGSLFSGTLSQTLGNSGYGFIGTTAANLFGLSNGIGSDIGGTAGSLIGSAVGGPVGAVAGGFLGSVFGGLFGGDDGKYQEAVKQRQRSLEADALAKQISQLIAATAETTQFAQAVEQIKAKFSDARMKAQEYGLSLDNINRAEQQQIDKLKQAFKDNIESQIAALENNPKFALEALKKAQDQRYKEALDAEADLARVRRLNELETEAFYKNLTSEQITAMGNLARAIDLINAQIKDLGSQLSTALQAQISLVQTGINDAKQQADTYRNLAATLRDQIFSLRTGNLTTLSQSDALGELRDRFAALMGDAKNGNQSALRALPQVANTLLEASSKYFGSTEAYARDFANVTASLQQAGISSDQFAGAQDYRSQLLQSQLGLLKAINDNLARESPDAPLLKEQLAALGVIGARVDQTNVISADQAQLLSVSNAIQDVLAGLAMQNAGVSQSIINAIGGSSASQISIGQAIVQGTYEMRDMLGKYIGILEQKAAQEAADKAKAAADAARQAQIDALLSTTRSQGNALKNALSSVPDSGGTENQHSWAVYFNAAANKFNSSVTADKGDPVWDRPRAESAANAIMSVMNAVIREVGITSVPQAMAYIATKYGSSLQVGGASFNTSINDYEGMATFGIYEALKQGQGGNPQLKNYALGLNWADIAGSLSALEKKAIDLGLRGFASGTLSAPPGLAWVGEEGPELIRFRGGEQVIPTNTSASLHQADVVKALQMHASVTVSQLRELRSEMASLRREFFLQRQENRAA